MESDKRWVLDANVWIELRDRYPSWIFETLWNGLSQSILAGRIQIPEEVLAEINVNEEKDWFESWKKDHLSSLVYETNNELLECVQVIIEEFEEKLIDPDIPQKNHGDPFLVGLAQLNEACVVSTENPAKQPNNHVKVPDVCQHYGINCIKLLEFLKEEIGKH